MADQPLRPRRGVGSHAFSSEERLAIITYLGKVLANARARSGRTLRDIGQAIGLSAAAVQRIERADFLASWPDLEKVLLFAREVDVPFFQLFPQNPASPEARLLVELARWPAAMPDTLRALLEQGSPRDLDPNDTTSALARSLVP